MPTPTPQDRSAQIRVTRAQIEGDGYIEDLVEDKKGPSTDYVYPKPKKRQVERVNEARLYADGCAYDLYD